MKAWRVTWKGMVHIVVNASNSGARSKAFRVLKDTGWRPQYFAIRCVRAPEHDAWAATTRWACVEESELKREQS